MGALTALRSVDVQDQPLGNSAARLCHLGYVILPQALLPATRYMRFRTQFADQSHMTGLIEIASWLTNAVPEVDGIDWHTLDEKLIPSLIAAYPLHLEIVNQHSSILNNVVAELVNDTHDLARYPRVATTSGAILIEQFHYGQTSDGGINAIHDAEDRLIRKLDFVVGYSNVPLHALATIEVGDVLLIAHRQERVIAADTALFNFSLNQQSILIDDLTDHDDQQCADKENATMNATSKLDDLPIELSFILMEKQVTLAELRTMAPGEVVELPPDQAMHVEIRANGRKFSQGELVQLSNGQLAVEIRLIA
jgi:type III secretion protein Q